MVDSQIAGSSAATFQAGAKSGSKRNLVYVGVGVLVLLTFVLVFALRRHSSAVGQTTPPGSNATSAQQPAAGPVQAAGSLPVDSAATSAADNASVTAPAPTTVAASASAAGSPSSDPGSKKPSAPAAANAVNGKPAQVNTKLAAANSKRPDEAGKAPDSPAAPATPPVAAAAPPTPTAAPEPAAVDFDPKSLDAKQNARLKIEAEQWPAGIDFTVEMNGKVYLRRSAAGEQKDYDNLFVPPGVQEFRVTASNGGVDKISNTVSTEFKAKKKNTLKIEARTQGQNSGAGVPQGLYPNTQIVLSLK
jgi:hypothetical protein